MIGKTVSHYRILSQLGSGGMGVVYGGEDIRLGRAVALKFVPEELGRDTPAIHRLHSEARTASGLNHPNICTIYDIGEHEGRPFVVMELLKGHTLRDRLARSPLKIHEAVDIGIQVAEALDAAHQHGVVHRDIKPANVFLVDHGPVKVLDFGLAKLLVDRTSATTQGPTIDRTAEGLTVGTVSYMSPEQVSGEPLDARTDLFSLGVVLYEGVTGRQPFTGKTSAVIFSAILTRAPVAPAVFNPNMPPRLQEVINNCLEKSRELRYPDAAALRADLKRVKRDLESGQSSTFRIPLAAADASIESPAGNRLSVSVPAADGAASHASVQAAEPRRRARLLVAVLVPVLAFGVGALWVASHRPTPASTRGANDSFVRTQLGLAAASLDAKDFRSALAHADQVLRVVPDDPTASRVRDEARQNIARFNDALDRAGERLAAGDRAGATSALAEARALDPGAPAVSDLAARLAGPTTRNEPPTVRARPAPAEPRARSVSPPPAVAVPAPSETLPRRPEPANGPPSTPPPVTASPTPAPVAAQAEPTVPAVVAPPPADVSPPLRATPAPEPRPAETDETTIRRLIATYARAIETKDLALFRTVKPNMSADEQRRIEDGFRAVSTQRVRLTILSIEPHGDEATVRAQRRDTIQAAGREQTADSVQTMTLARGTSGWVIRDIR